jgi:hypothetical protein
MTTEYRQFRIDLARDNEAIDIKCLRCDWSLRIYTSFDKAMDQGNAHLRNVHSDNSLFDVCDGCQIVKEVDDTDYGRFCKGCFAQAEYDRGVSE